jgi:FtsP/CotA-like multicopper oxidase with cupredoxin domain
MSVGGAPVLMSDPDQPYGVLPFAVDASLPARIARVPEQLDGVLGDLAGSEVETREVSLEMGMGGMMMGSGGFAINGRPYDMAQIDFAVAQGTVERWHIRSTMVAHPFHVHGVRFRVLSENGAPPRPENTGWKDTFLVPNEAEIIARFDQPARHETPYMFHCHILEHEDAGMMGQFTVT